MTYSSAPPCTYSSYVAVGENVARMWQFGQRQIVQFGRRQSSTVDRLHSSFLRTIRMSYAIDQRRWVAFLAKDDDYSDNVVLFTLPRLAKCGPRAACGHRVPFVPPADSSKRDSMCNPLKTPSVLLWKLWKLIYLHFCMIVTENTKCCVITVG